MAREFDDHPEATACASAAGVHRLKPLSTPLRIVCDVTLPGAQHKPFVNRL